MNRETESRQVEVDEFFEQLPIDPPRFIVCDDGVCAFGVAHGVADVQAAACKDGSAPVQPPPSAYDVIAIRNLFKPNRSEAAIQTASPVAKPVLCGVVINGDTRFAYLEDPAIRRVSGYKSGDALAGGQVERIETDRVVIKRAEGPLEVMLRDPNKPKPAVSAPTPPKVVRPEPLPTIGPSAPGLPQIGGGTFR